MIAIAEALPYRRTLPNFTEQKVFFSKLINSAARKLDKFLTLKERIAKYGKIRVLFVCDENLGRSPFFAAAMNKRIESLGIGEFVEVLSAGTRVDEKGSQFKYDGEMHPQVKRHVVNGIGEGFSKHTPTQFNSNMLNKNTILVILNDGKKILKKDRKKCLSVFDCGMEDPHDAGPQNSLGARLNNLEELLFWFTSDLTLYLLNAIKHNSTSSIPRTKKIDLQNTYCGCA